MLTVFNVYTYWPFCVFFYKYPVKSFDILKIDLCNFFLLFFTFYAFQCLNYSSWCILGTSSLPDTWIVIIIPFGGCLFIFLTVFQNQVLILMKSDYQFYLLFIMLFYFMVTKIFSYAFLLYNLAFMVSSLWGQDSFFFQYSYLFVLAQFVVKTILYPLNCFGTLVKKKKISWLYMCMSVSSLCCASSSTHLSLHWYCILLRIYAYLCM